MDALIDGQANLANGTFNVEVYTQSVLTYVYFYALLGILLFLLGLSSVSLLSILSSKLSTESSLVSTVEMRYNLQFVNFD